MFLKGIFVTIRFEFAMNKNRFRSIIHTVTTVTAVLNNLKCSTTVIKAAEG